jgi:hypothetical protein
VYSYSSVQEFLPRKILPRKRALAGLSAMFSMASFDGILRAYPATFFSLFLIEGSALRISPRLKVILFSLIHFLHFTFPFTAPVLISLQVKSNFQPTV